VVAMFIALGLNPLVEFLMRLALVESPSSEPERQREVLSILSGALGKLDSWCVAFRVA